MHLADVQQEAEADRMNDIVKPTSDSFCVAAAATLKIWRWGLRNSISSSRSVVLHFRGDRDSSTFRSSVVVFASRLERGVQEQVQLGLGDAARLARRVRDSRLGR
jgi:hypothetical protein